MMLRHMIKGAILLLAACSSTTTVTMSSRRGYLDEIRNYARTHDREEAMTYAMLRHIEWIIANSDLAYHGEPLPPVDFKSRKYLRAIGMSAYYYSPSRSTTTDVLDFMWLPDPYYFNHIDSQKAVHELVHFLQRVNGRTATLTCRQLELQARELEVAWMAAHGREYKYSSEGLGSSTELCEKST